MAAVLDYPVSRTRRNRETSWVNRLLNREESTPEYQELKFTLHRKLSGPDQPGGALLHGGRACPRHSSGGRRQAR